MKKYLIATGLILSLCLSAWASLVGDEYIRLGDRINRTALSEGQQQALLQKLSEAEDILNGGSNTSGFICINGTVHGPNSQQIWTGDFDSCSNPDKVYILGDYACATGTLYGYRGSLKWTGDFNACGDRKKVRIGKRYACAMGTVFGPNGFQQWTGDFNYCEKAVLN